MDIRRAKIAQGIKKVATGPASPRKFGAGQATINTAGKSKAEDFMAKRVQGDLSDNARQQISEERYSDILIRGTQQANETTSPAPLIVYSNSFKKNQEIRQRYGFDKSAATVGIGGGTGNSSFNVAGGQDTIRQAPEVYSPLFQIANLQLPRDRVTMNAWNRNFYDTHPLVHNCINLHATYPLGKINIKCKYKHVEEFFSDMAEEMDLIGILHNVALEFWKLGERIQGSSLITMGDGTLKPIFEIQVGDEVITHLGNRKKVIERFAKPTNTVIEEDLKIYKVYVQGLVEPLVISGKHPVLSSSGSNFMCPTPPCGRKNLMVLPDKCKCGNCHKENTNRDIEPLFVASEKLQQNDIVYAPFTTDVVDNDIFSEDLCYIMGFWLAEGSYCKRKVKDGTKLNGLRLAGYDKDLLNANAILFKKCFGHDGTIYTGKPSGFQTSSEYKYDYQYTGKLRDGPKWAQFFKKHCGEYSLTKRLSKDIMLLPSEKQIKLLAGFIDGDGCIDKSNGQLIICSSSRDLSNQFLEILRRAGSRPTISKQLSVCRGIKGNYNYRVKISATEATRLFKGLLLSDKNDKLVTSKWSSSRSALQNNWQLLRIKKIEDITDSFQDKFMYDIEVEDDHSYIANGMAIHNCFPYAELDPDKGVWKNIVIQNPDYIHVKTSVLSGDSVISMRPDAALQRLVTSNNPADVKLRQQIDEEILYHIRKGNNVPLDNFHVSHLKMLSSPYDNRGTSLVVSIYKDLMLYDKLRECYSEDTEVLTEDGFKKFNEVIDFDENDITNAKAKSGVKIACFNSENEKIEFHSPLNTHLSNYKGEMYHFNGKKVDTLVTPNHRMWVNKSIKRKGKKVWSDWHIEKAEDISKSYWYRFRAHAEWPKSELDINNVNVIGHDVPIDLYLQFLGYIISEGCVYQNYKNGRYDNSVSMCQNTDQPHYENMKKVFVNFADRISKNTSEHIRVTGSGFSKNNPKEKWEICISSKDLVNYFIKEIGTDNKCKSKDKRVPGWIFKLPENKINIFLNALLDGDGRRSISKYGTGSKSFRYTTASKQLADDVYRLVYQVGSVPSLTATERETCIEYNIAWSDTKYGDEPLIYGNHNHGGANIDKVSYDGKVWCFEVPTGLFITRRNGKITIQGNSKFAQADNLINPITIVTVGGAAEGEYHPTEADLESWRSTLEAAQYDKDFKIISHAGVKIERVGASGSIIDISGDMSFIMDNILYGLMTPKAVITQEGASYNSASIGLEVLKQRYDAFRNMIAKWLKVKIFAPISEIQEFYEYDGGNKKLIVPDIDWNQMILFDMDNYIGILNQMTQPGPQGEPPKVSSDTLFRSLGLDPSEERRKVRHQMVQDTIAMKEKLIANKLSLSQLRALKEDEDIIEPTDQFPLPGVPGAEEQFGQPPGLGGMPGLGGPLGGGLGGPPMGGGLGGPLGGAGGGLGGPEPGLEGALPPGGAGAAGPEGGAAPPAGEGPAI